MIEIDPESRAETARAYFNNGFNCCQSVVMTFSDVLGLDERTLGTLSVGFGGGMGRMREVCGAFSGIVMAAGRIGGTERAQAYAVVQELAQRFKDANNGYILCRDLLGLDDGVHESAVPAERNAEYYKTRPCGDIVASAARIIAEKLISER